MARARTSSRPPGGSSWRSRATVCIALNPSEDAGFFGPTSVVWKVDRELAVLLGSGSRALLLQVAHPLGAAAVAQHSRYRTDPIGRLRHTLEAIYAFAFSDLEHATHMVETINRRHASVTGTSPDGTPYAALDPHLLLWV